ncbi:MAG: tetratricopeptide repeat protein, partial [Bacteroidia bacterium]
MKRFRLVLVFLLGGLFFQPQDVLAQTGSEKTIISRADQLFQQREYEQAFSYYMKLKELHPDILMYQFRAGVCCIYQGDGEQALTLLKPCYEKEPNTVDINFFLGRAYLLNDMFDDALLQFNLQLAKETNEAEKVRLQQYVTNCMSGKELIGKQANTLIENPGRPLNTPGAEFAPILTRNDSVVIYTYKGPLSTGGKDYTFGKKDSAGIYYEDVFLSMKGRNGWFFPQGLSTSLNSNA